MDQLICTACGANDFITKNGYRICKYCDTKYADKTAAAAVSSVVSIQSDVDILLEKCKDDPANARRYANRILDIDPTNKAALMYLRR